jgi:hypothetical protein
VTDEDFNRACILKLKELSFENRVVVVGAGPSTPIVTSLSGLMSRLSSACCVDQRSGNPFWEFCEECFRSDEKRYYDTVRECFGEEPHWRAVVYQHLVEIPFRSFVTLNYDHQLPDAFRERYRDVPPKELGKLFSVYPPLVGQKTVSPSAFFEPKQHLVAIHGFADESNDPDWPRKIILKASDYEMHYVSDETGFFLVNWWENLLTSHPCVFIGTSLQEPGLNTVIKGLKVARNPRVEELDHIHLIDDSDASGENFPGQFDLTLGAIKKIPYRKKNSRYSGLLDVLEPFSGVPTTYFSPGHTAPMLSNPSEPDFSQ